MDASRRSLRIVLLEDSASDATLVERELDKGGLTYTLRRVQTRADFARALAEGQPDLVLADYALPSFDGHTALRMAMEVYPDLPFVFVSGEMGEERAIEALKSGATDYVLKDRLGRLVPAVERALREAQERRRRRAAEAGLRHAHEELAKQAELLDLTHDAIYMHTLKDATILYWNRGAAERYGYSAAEAVGQCSHALTRTLFPEPLEEIYARVIESGRWEGELIHTRRDGTQITVASRWALQRDRDGQPVAVLEINNDITEYKRVEAQREAVLTELQVKQEQLRALARRRAEIQEHDFAFVADQLYNEAGQVLAALKIQLGMFEAELAAGQASPQRLAEMRDTADRVLRDLHDLATHLRPVSLDRVGLAAALEQYLAAFGSSNQVGVKLATCGLEHFRASPGIETAFYRIAQEAMANVAQHARASQVDVTLSRMGRALILLIQDNGRGFDAATALRRGAPGLVGMRERAEALGGSLEIESAPGAGTSVLAEVPCDTDDPLVGREES